MCSPVSRRAVGECNAIETDDAAKSWLYSFVHTCLRPFSQQCSALGAVKRQSRSAWANSRELRTRDRCRGQVQRYSKDCSFARATVDFDHPTMLVDDPIRDSET